MSTAIRGTGEVFSQGTCGGRNSQGGREDSFPRIWGEEQEVTELSKRATCFKVLVRISVLVLFGKLMGAEIFLNDLFLITSRNWEMEGVCKM